MRGTTVLKDPYDPSLIEKNGVMKQTEACDPGDQDTRLAWGRHRSQLDIFVKK